MSSIFLEKANRIKANSVDDILFRIFDSSFVKDWLVDTVKDRVQFTGIDSFGDKLRTDTARKGFSDLGFYSTFTEQLNKESGKSSGHVSLHDGGRFWDSLKSETKKKFTTLKANFKKGSEHIGDNFEAQYGSNKLFEQAILSLTSDEFQFLIFKIVLPRLIQILRNDVY